MRFDEMSVHAKAEDSPGFLLWRVSSMWRRMIESVLRPLGLTHPQFVILTTIAYLTKDGSGASQVHIARLAGLDPNTTSQIIRGLEKKMFIERSYKKDERSKFWMVTHKGQDTLSKALPAVEGADQEFFKPVDLEKINAKSALVKLAGF